MVAPKPNPEIKTKDTESELLGLVVPCGTGPGYLGRQGALAWARVIGKRQMAMVVLLVVLQAQMGRQTQHNAAYLCAEWGKALS